MFLNSANLERARSTVRLELTDANETLPSRNPLTPQVVAIGAVLAERRPHEAKPGVGEDHRSDPADERYHFALR